MTVGEAVEQEVITSDWIAYYLGVAKNGMNGSGSIWKGSGSDSTSPGERAHYASDCWDAESEVDGDWIEITGFAYRGCYDLKKHQEHSGENFEIFKEYDEPQTEKVAKINPDMSWLGPTYGDHASEIIDELQKMVEVEPEIFERTTGA